jgi:carbamoyl-phosphate synthase large subunit
MTRVLVTGAGGPAGVAVIRSLLRDPTVEVLAADIDPYAAGLYLVDAQRRWLVPPGDARDFVSRTMSLCESERVDVLVPTVDAELLPIAEHRADFAAAGVLVALTNDTALQSTLDKLALAQACAGAVPAPRTEVLGAAVDPSTWDYPVIAKPRHGSGSRGVVVVPSASELGRLPADKSMILQEHLPGAEYSLDVMADLDARVVSVVPRERLRVDSGVSVAGRTLHDPELDALARSVVRALGLTLVANVQCRRDRQGRAALLEVNPRFPGALPLTIHSGVDMTRLCLDAMLGLPLPESVPHRDVTMVRFLDDRFLDASEVVEARTPVGVR